MSAKHTPGPWIAAAAFSSVVGLPVVAPSGRSVASVTFFRLGGGFQNHDQESHANARLIAAAPDMLAALKTARETILDLAQARGSEVEFAEDRVADIDAAIAKVEGRS